MILFLRMTAARAARNSRRRASHSAMMTACWYSGAEAACPAQIAFAMHPTCTESLEIPLLAAAQPWRQALRLARDLPRRVLGPVLFCAFNRLAVIFLSDVM